MSCSIDLKLAVVATEKDGTKRSGVLIARSNFFEANTMPWPKQEWQDGADGRVGDPNIDTLQVTEVLGAALVGEDRSSRLTEEWIQQHQSWED